MIGRTVPIALAGHLAEAATSDCRLWRVTSAAGAELGLTTLDRDVEYDDGDGLITYLAHRGYTPFAIESSADLAVDNSEMEALLAEFEVDGFTADAIQRGVYDGARYIEYLVNYNDLSDGHAIIGSGRVGRIRQVDNMVCFPEIRSLTQVLKQKSLIERGSNSCRVEQFGNARCGKDVASLWVDFTVTAVGAETDRVFTMSGTAPADNALNPGLTQFYTGDNAGRYYEHEGNVGAVITLAIPTEKPIQIGDTGRRRVDCTRLLTGDNGCIFHGRRLSFRGEWYRQVSQTEQLQSPGAGSTGVTTTTTGSTDTL